MNAVKRMFSFTVIFFLSKYCLSQPVSIPREITALALKYCKVCSRSPKDSASLLNKKEGAMADFAYHNCHVFWSQNETDSSYTNILQTLPFFSYSMDSKKCNVLEYVKAKILFRKQLYNEALDDYRYLLKRDDLEKEIRCNVNSNVGEIFLDQNNYAQALFYLSQSINGLSAVNEKTLGRVFCNIASCYLFTKKSDSAEIYYQKSEAIFEKLNDTLGLAINYSNIGNHYYSIYKDALAFRYFKKGLDLALQTNDFTTKQYSYFNLSVFYENKNEFQQALTYRKAYENQHDSLYNRDNVYKLGQMAVKEKEHTLQIAQEENQLQVLQLEKQTQRTYLSLLLALVFSAFFVVSYYAYYQKRRQNAIISAQREELDVLNQTKNQLFSVVAHDLRSPVQTLKITLQKLRVALSEQNIIQAEQASSSVENISNATFFLLNNLLHWALSQTEQLSFIADQLNVSRVVDTVFCDYLAMALTKEICLTNEVPNDVYCIADVNTVKIILRNLIDNAIKFSEPSSRVIVSAIVKNNQCIISVTDEGKGIEDHIIHALADNNIKRINAHHTKRQSTGIGLWLTKTMTERNKGRLEIEQKPGSTKINIYLPHPQKYEQTQNTYC